MGHETSYADCLKETKKTKALAFHNAGLKLISDALECHYGSSSTVDIESRARRYIDEAAATAGDIEEAARKGDEETLRQIRGTLKSRHLDLKTDVGKGEIGVRR